MGFLDVALAPVTLTKQIGEVQRGERDTIQAVPTGTRFHIQPVSQHPFTYPQDAQEAQGPSGSAVALWIGGGVVSGLLVAVVASMWSGRQA